MTEARAEVYVGKPVALVDRWELRSLMRLYTSTHTWTRRDDGKLLLATSLPRPFPFPSQPSERPSVVVRHLLSIIGPEAGAGQGGEDVELEAILCPMDLLLKLLVYVALRWGG